MGLLLKTKLSSGVTEHLYSHNVVENICFGRIWSI